MNAVAQQEAIAITFEEVKLLIWDTCHKFYRRYGNLNGTVEELFSLAQLSFMKAYHSYTKTTASFATWVRWYIWHELLEYQRGDMRRNKAAKVTPTDMVENDNFIANQSNFKMIDFVDGLSEDAKMVVNLVLDPPDGLAAAMRKRGPGDGRTKLSIEQFLLGFEWDSIKISEVFSEISTALRS